MQPATTYSAKKNNKNIYIMSKLKPNKHSKIVF